MPKANGYLFRGESLEGYSFNDGGGGAVLAAAWGHSGLNLAFPTWSPLPQGRGGGGKPVVGSFQHLPHSGRFQFTNKTNKQKSKNKKKPDEKKKASLTTTETFQLQG